MIKDKFIYNENEVSFVEPSCKKCAYAIKNGVEGCKIDKQTLEVKFGLEECNYIKKLVTNR